jgi:ribosome-binding protein aMBF1 (putative translation factor)
MIGFLPKLIAWLGYDPFPEPTTAGEEIVAMRRRRGLSRKKLARQLVIDETTLKKIEKSEMVLTERVVEVMRETLTARSDQETREAANL